MKLLSSSFLACSTLRFIAVITQQQCLSVRGAVVISEISDKGTSSVCDGSDWVELYNDPAAAEEDGAVSVNQVATAVDLSGYALTDAANDTFSFQEGWPALEPGEYLFLCMDDPSNPITSPQFRIGGDDTITLLDRSNRVVSSVTLPDGSQRAFDVTYARESSMTSYTYTSTPTPGEANIITPIIEETAEMIKQRLATQNEQGERFFNMDSQGLPVPNGMDEVLDLHLTMEPEDFNYMMVNASFQLYSPFTSARVTPRGLPDQPLLEMDSPGRLRPKGQSTLYVSNCLNTTSMPYLLEFNTQNTSQTMFGAERVYLRMHFDDNSNMREWAAHRMLARFGLPHLRARTMRFFINGERMGFYTVMEAVDQEYVFHRSFPDMDPTNHALYKVKSLSLGCGGYSTSALEQAQLRIEEETELGTATPYIFERGDHREKTPVRTGEDAMMQCFNDFFENIFTEFEDITVAYLRNNEDCGQTLVEEGIIDRDLGQKNWDPVMEAFINENLANNACDKGCMNSNLTAEVDVSNFLKSFAFYAATIMMDSPLGNGNNYYLAEAGTGHGWAIVGYDHNLRGGSICGETCDAHLPYWSIVRPTCGALEDNQLVGPLLTNATLHAQYMEYVREFTREVLGNQSFTMEMMRHAEAIEDDVREDVWSLGGQFFSEELSPDAALWNGTRSPLLAFYKARVESINEQLEAYDQGTFPRGPHLDAPVQPYELCVDWRIASEDTPWSNCSQGCMYDGCKRTGLMYLSWCDEPNGVCYQGEIDDGCANLETGQRYEGMENTEDGRDTFCVAFPPFFAMKTNVCPEYTGTGEPGLSTPDQPAMPEDSEPDDGSRGSSDAQNVGSTTTSAAWIHMLSRSVWVASIATLMLG